MSAWATMRKLSTGLRPVRVHLILSIACRLLQQALDMAMVSGVAWMLATAFDGASFSWTPLAILGAAAVVRAVARYGEQYLGHYVAFGLLASLRVGFFEAIRPLMPAALASDTSGDLVERVTIDVDRVEVFYAHTLAPLITALVVPMAAVAAMAVVVHPVPALWLLATMTVAGVFTSWLGWQRAIRLSEAAAGAEGQLAAHLTDGVQGLADVAGFGRGERRVAEMQALADSAAVAERAAARAEGWRTSLFDMMAGVAFVAVLLSGVDLVSAGRLETGPLAAAVAVALVVFVPLRDLQQVRPALERAVAAAGRIFAVTDRPAPVTDPSRPRLPGQPSLAFRRVGFAYPGREAAALNGVDVEVGAGRTVAVVGPSGSGKSTLAALAARYWEPDAGEVVVGGVPADQLSLQVLRSQVAVATQRPHLLSGSIRDNLLIGRPDAGTDEVEMAIRVAAIDAFIAGLPAGIDTQVGELGGRLSGGQRQRVALARALLADTPIVVLDEATSDLDVDTETEVMTALRASITGKAVLFIAHRLTTVVDADEIVVMDGGVIIERGDHDSLVEQNGLYARLWARQLDALP